MCNVLELELEKVSRFIQTGGRYADRRGGLAANPGGTVQSTFSSPTRRFTPPGEDLWHPPQEVAAAA